MSILYNWKLNTLNTMINENYEDLEILIIGLLEYDDVLKIENLPPTIKKILICNYDKHITSYYGYENLTEYLDLMYNNPKLVPRVTHQP